jgi:protoporphyrinogen oxidase
MTQQKKTVVVLGAGPAGLAAAYTAQKAGYHVVVIERSDIAGGKGASRSWKNFIVDYGPHTFHAMTQEITDLVMEHGEGGMFDLAIKQRLYITEKPMGYPFNLKEAFLKFSFWLNLRILWDYGWVKVISLFRKLPQGSFKEYGIANFGKTLYDICFGDYSERVWGCSAQKLSVEFARRKLPNVSLGAFIAQVITRKKKENFKSYLHIRRYMYHTHGIGTIFKNMADGIVNRGGEIIYNAAISAIDRSATGDIERIRIDTPHGAEIRADLVVSTIPLDSLLGYLSPDIPELSGIEQDLPFRHGIIVNVVINREKLDDPHWMYLVNKRFYFNRVSESKNFSPRCAPKDKTLLMLEKICLPDDPVWGWTIDQWRVKVQEDLGFLGVMPSEIDEIFTTKMEKAFPFYKVGYESRKNLFLDQMARVSNLVTTGRYGLFLDINMHDAMVLGIQGFKYLVDGRLREFYDNHENIPLKLRQTV